MGAHNRKPTAGYPSRTEAVLAMRDKGLSPPEIAAELQIAYGTVKVLIAKSAAGPPPVKVSIAHDHVRALTPHADRRGCTVHELVRRIVGTVADAGLVDAVLDDGGP